MNKKKRRRTKISWIADIPVGVCIFFIIIGIIIGNVFVIGTWHWGKLIDKSEAIPITATFESYKMRFGKSGSVNEIEIYFRDKQKLCIDGACIDIDVETALENTKQGDRVDLLLHPNSEYIWEMKTKEAVILSFADAKSRMRSENIGFSVILGATGYLCAIMGAISLLIQAVRRRKIKS
ncbi:MAG: hypothetical protein E7539_06800 [Ruminococcaceae bacterium]|nr:hypothetical protein [Oscillospiraceae bacterium]